jgi:hypothetical protein
MQIIHIKYTQNCPVARDAALLNWVGGHVITKKAWPCIIVGTVFGYYHASCALKNSFVDLKKGVDALKSLRKQSQNRSNLPNSPCFPSDSQSSFPIFSSPGLFLYNIYILLNSVWSWICNNYLLLNV